MKRSRSTLAKRLLRADGIKEKLDIVFGKDLFAYHSGQPQTLGGVMRVIGFALGPEKRKLGLPAPAIGATINRRTQSLAALGQFFVTQIAQRDNRFFATLASLLQHDLCPPKANELYRDILIFCFAYVCGTPSAPADARDLWKYLKSKGHVFQTTSVNQVPSGLKAACARIGVCLSVDRRGRPSASA